MIPVTNFHQWGSTSQRFLNLRTQHHQLRTKVSVRGHFKLKAQYSMYSTSFLLILNGIYFINLLLRYFYFLAVMNNTIMNINWRVLRTCVFHCLGNIHGRGVIHSHGNSQLSLLRNCRIGFDTTHSFSLQSVHVKWYHIVVLVSISLTTKNTEHICRVQWPFVYFI